MAKRAAEAPTSRFLLHSLDTFDTAPAKACNGDAASVDGCTTCFSRSCSRRSSMNALSQRIGVMVVAAAAALGMAAVTAPAASAASAAAPASITVAGPRPAWWCKPAHSGPNWRWDDGRRGGHWDKREWNRRQQRFVWTHQWRDDRYCAPLRNGRPDWDGNGRPDGNGNGNNNNGNRPR
jgi:hypothetical protein